MSNADNSNRYSALQMLPSEAEELDDLRVRSLSIWGVGSIVINILMATGPFILPFAYLKGGYVLTTIVFALTTISAFISFDQLIDATAQTNAAR